MLCNTSHKGDNCLVNRKGGKTGGRESCACSHLLRVLFLFGRGLCVGSFSSTQDLAGEALAWQCSAVARTRALQAVKDRALKDRAALHEGLVLAAPSGVPGAGPRPPSAGAQAAAVNPGNAHPGVVGTPPGTIGKWFKFVHLSVLKERYSGRSFYKDR